ncbi:MAG TPA: ABC transporter permease [bacterium]
MLKNYLKIALRNSLKHKGYSLINVLGLAIGMTCCLLIFLFVQDELAFDTFHPDRDRIYRVNKMVREESGDLVHTAEMPGNFAPTLRRDYPQEVQRTVRLRPWWNEMLISHGDKKLKIEHVVFADTTFFAMFDFDLVAGDRQQVLRDPLCAVITEEVAQQFFGDADPIGQVLEGLFGMPLVITGIARNPPVHSHLQFDILISWATTTNSAYAERFDWMNRWITQAVFTYVQLTPGADPNTLEEKFPRFMQEHMTRWADKYFPYLQPLGDIHLKSSNIPPQFQMNVNAGNIQTVYVLSIIAILILVIACINYMNLAAARATRRAQEVGLRKVVGADQRQLISQFLGESCALALVALILALVLVELCLPTFSQLTQRQLLFEPVNNAALLLGLLGATLLVGLAAGSYPAFVLSSFQPGVVLKNAVAGRVQGALFRRTLVVAQFVAAVSLIIATLVVNDQRQYMRHKNLGFQKEHVVLIDIPSSTIRAQAQTFKNELLRHPQVLSAALASGGPSIGTMGFEVLPEGWSISAGFAVPTIGVDFDFVGTYGLEMATGRNFDLGFPTDSSATLINETLAKQLGWESPVGKRLALGTDSPEKLTVIGVVKDFHIRSVHQKIEPVLLYITSQRFNRLAVKLSGHEIARTLEFIAATWQRFEDKYPFEYRFLDEAFEKYYVAEERLTETLGIFTMLAIAIACLGLFALAAYAAEQRTKEIGIRKVLGASVAGIMALLSRDFLKLVVLANVVAWPVAYFMMNRWLETFAYRIDLGWWVFALAGGLALLISLLTVGTQAIKAAVANPVDSLKYE